MLTTRRSLRQSPLLLGCLTAALLTTQVVAIIPVTIDYTNGQTDATSYDTSGPNDPTGLSILSGTATQSGILTGSGSVIKVGDGTLILSGANDYSGGTTLNAGTLQVVATGAISHDSSNLTIGDQSGDAATLLLSGGSISNTNANLGIYSGSSGTATVSAGSWTSYYQFTIGNSGTGVFNLSGGTVSNVLGFMGLDTNSSGTANISGGTWTTSSVLFVGFSGTAALNLSDGTVSSSAGTLGGNVGSSGTANVSGGTWTNKGALTIGDSGTGVLNISGGTVSNDSGTVGNSNGSNGTATVSGGTWTTSGDLTVGNNGTGVLNLANHGTVSVGSGTLYLANNVGSTGTLNLGTGGAAGTLQADYVSGGDGTAVVNFNHTGSYTFKSELDGNLSVNQFGPGTTTLTAANTYTGDTSVLGGTLALILNKFEVLSDNTSLDMGSGTLLLSGSKTEQFLNGLNTVGGAGSIVLGGQNQTLAFGYLGTVADSSALNFNTAAGGANGSYSGTSVIQLHGQSTGDVINPGFTVTDSTGFGLATVNDKDLVVRLTTTSLLPATSLRSRADFRIDNNSGDNTTAGSSTLIVTANQTVRSITVDTTAASGVLTLADNVVLITGVLNFGSAAGSSHAYNITGGASSGITTGVSGGFLQINNYNASPVTISTSILDDGGSGLQISGPGTTILTATSSYTGDTLVTSGVLEVAASGSIYNNPGATTIGSQRGDQATLLISGGTVSNNNGYLGYYAGSSGTANVSSGTWTNNGDLIIGNSGTGTLNISCGSVSNSFAYLGRDADGSGTANVSGGTWTNIGILYLGASGTGVLNITGGSVSDILSVLGYGIGSSGTATVSGGTWSGNSLYVGSAGTGVLNLTDNGTVSIGGGNGTLTLARIHGSSGTLNLGTGGTAGTLNAASIIGGTGTAVVNFNQDSFYTFSPTLAGSLTVNQIGTGTTALTAASTYTGATNVLAGTLALDFGPVSANILPTTTDLTLSNATLLVSGAGSQTLHSLSLTANSAGSIFLNSANETLDLGPLASVGPHAALNFFTASGGADADTATVGTSVVLLDGQTAGSVINPNFTVTDSTGFGLATVDNLGEIVRLTSTALLPASGALAPTDYRIDNNSGDSTTAGSASLIVTGLESARSITVDNSVNKTGLLTLASGAVLSSDVWNFGGSSKRSYEITGSDSGAGITTATAGGTLQFNNYLRRVTLSTSILDNGTSSVLFHGPGITFLTGSNSYLGDTTVSSGVLKVEDTGSINSNGTTTIGSQSGDNAVLYLYGVLQDQAAMIGDAAGALGTVTVTGGKGWSTDGNITVGNSGTGVLNIDNGHMQSTSGYIGVNAGSSGTVTVSNFGEWDLSKGLVIGQDGTGVLNLTDRGSALVGKGSGTVTLGSQGTLNIGTGGVAGVLQTQTVTGVSGAVVNYNYNGFKNAFKVPSNPLLTGDLAVNKLGGGYLSFSKQNSYTGGTTVNGGFLELNFGIVTSNIISSASALTLGGGTLSLYSQIIGTATQTLNGLTTTAGTGSQIVLGSHVTLNLGSLTSAGQGSALNFDTSQGDADGTRVGTGIVLLSGQTIGTAINPGFTVTDSTGFGLATVNPLNQIVRLTDSNLLPASGTLPGMDYLIDNNDGDNTAGSSSLEITASQTARSITVDTSNSSGLLTLDTGVVLSSDVWNFGSNNSSNNYVITGSDPGAGISTATAGGMLQINNYNSNSIVTISAPILDNGGSGLRVAGTGVTLLNGTDTYTGETIINSGTLFINGDHSAATGTVTVQSAATLSGVGTLGSDVHVQNGGILAPGNFLGLGTLTGTTATFDTNSVFYVQSAGTFMTSLHLTGSVSIAPGALIYADTSDLSQSKYVLMTAASGLDASTPFTVKTFFGVSLNGIDVIPGYHLAYTGTELDLVANITVPSVAYWTGAQSSNWSDSNWATAADGLTVTGAPPGTPTDVTFSATGVGLQQTNLTADFTVNSLTVNSDTTISAADAQTLTVNNATSVNALLAIDTGVTLAGKDNLTISTTGTLTGSSIVQMDADKSIIVQGALSVGAPGALIAGYETLSLTTSGTGSIVMDPGSVIIINLLNGAGFGASSLLPADANQLSLHGTLDATAGGTLVLGNPHALTGYVDGDHWKVVDLNSGAGTITGHLALNDSSLGLATGFVGTFDQTTGIYSIADHRPEMTTQTSGLPMANAESQSTLSGAQTSTNDVNNHLFNLRSGGGEEDGPDGSIASSVDDGVVVGQGDGPENPIAKRIKRTRQWEVFTTVNYGNVKLSPISSQSGVQVDSWASSVGIERHLSRGITLGFAVTYLTSTQTYTSGLGRLNLEGPSLSTYLAYVRKAFWGSLLYSFGDYDLDSTRNPGLGLPSASASTRSYTNSVQFNTGWNFRFQNNTLVTGPFTGIDYLHGTVDAYGETGGGTGALKYGRQTFQSLVTRVGWSASKKFETNWATITPQLRLSYERQNVRNNGTSVSLINAPFTATGGHQNPGQDYMVIGTGVNFIFTPDFSMLLGYQVQLFRNNMEAHFGSVRFGYKF